MRIFYFILVCLMSATIISLPAFANSGTQVAVAKPDIATPNSSVQMKTPKSEPKTRIKRKPVDRTVNKLVRSYVKGQSFQQSFRTIVALGPEANTELFRLAKDKNVPDHQRWTSIRAIGRIGDRNVEKELAGFLNYPHPILRMASLRALADLGAKDSIPQIMETAQKDSAMLVRNEAVQSLGRLKATEAIPVLEETFDDERNFYRGQSLFIRRQVVLALGEMKNPNAAPLLIKALDDSDRRIPVTAIQSLQRVTGLQFEGKTVGSARDQWKSWWVEEQKRRNRLSRDL